MLEKRKNDEVRGQSELILRTSDVRVLSHFCGLREEGTEHQEEAGLLPALCLGLALYQEHGLRRQGTQQMYRFRALGPPAVGLWVLPP